MRTSYGAYQLHMGRTYNVGLGGVWSHHAGPLTRSQVSRKKVLQTVRQRSRHCRTTCPAPRLTNCVQRPPTVPRGAERHFWPTHHRSGLVAAFSHTRFPLWLTDQRLKNDVCGKNSRLRHLYESYTKSDLELQHTRKFLFLRPNEHVFYRTILKQRASTQRCPHQN